VNDKIRNFSIIAHIDHGKSSLAQRLAEFSAGAVDDRRRSGGLKDSLVFDNMELEKLRGITIKQKTLRLLHNDYILNLIDTPGHVDFNYEVSRSLAASDGALLLVDATQGIQAQTISNLYLALEYNLAIIPVINKIDLPSADIERVKREIAEVIGGSADDAILVSAKTGEGVEDVLNAIVERIPSPRLDDQMVRWSDGQMDSRIVGQSLESHGKTQALIYDSYFDNYRGVVASVRVFNGSVCKGDNLKFVATGKVFECTEVGYFSSELVATDGLFDGDVGYVCGSLKDVRSVRVGDTITKNDNPAPPLPGYREPQPVVFCGLFPVDSVDYDNLRDSLEKLQLNDSAVKWQPETSAALGFGFRCGFLGLLHMDITQERLEREYNLNLVVTAPSVAYKVEKTNGEIITVNNPAELPTVQEIKSVDEPIVKATVIVPSDFIGAVMELCQNKRGVYVSREYISTDRVIIIYRLPLNEIVFDFFDTLKSISKGYASLDYELVDYIPAYLVKLYILLNGDILDALGSIVHRTRAAAFGRALALKLKKIIPEQLFDIPIQAAIGSKIIARETVKARRKDVLAKCYGGDVSRKRKLLEKQKAGKKRMKAVGKVQLPQDAFMAVLGN